MRRARPYLIVLALAVLGVVALFVWALGRGVWLPGAVVLGCVPLVVLGLPAGLLAWATIRHGDPYDVSHRYR